MTGDEVRAFISYAHEDRTVAAQAKRSLENVGVSAFLAHEDLQISEEWEARIRVELAGCDVFVALLSKHSRSSSWASQEAGFIASRLAEVVVLPLSLDGTRTEGFLRHLQSPSIDQRTGSQVLVEPIAGRFPRTVLPKLIKEAVAAGSFDRASELLARLSRFFPLMTADEAQAFAEGAAKNTQVWLATKCQREYLPKFMQIQGANINPETARALRYQIEHDQWYRPES